MQIIEEGEILEESLRSRIITEINGSENTRRKAQAKKRYDCYRDQTRSYVVDMIYEEYSDQSVAQEMAHRATNVSFLKQIIQKKARVYKEPVKRTASVNQEQVDMLTKACDINLVMKKANIFSELFRNTVIQVAPVKRVDSDEWYIQPRVLRPFDYDVIEDRANPEAALVYILSYYDSTFESTRYEATPYGALINKGDGVDQLIADSRYDFNNRKYIWWTSNYHFTTDNKGEIVSEVSPPDSLNPIGKLPFVNLAMGQDGQFWAEGGDDLVDGSIALNLSLPEL